MWCRCGGGGQKENRISLHEFACELLNTRVRNMRLHMNAEIERLSPESGAGKNID